MTRSQLPEKHQEITSQTLSVNSRAQENGGQRGLRTAGSSGWLLAEFTAKSTRKDIFLQRGKRTMKTSRARTVCIAVAGIATVVFGSMAAYAAITVFRQDAYSPYIGLRGGEAQLTARVLRTPVGETTGAWHYHPGNVYNVVTQGTITIEDGCGAINQYSKGQAFETSEGRVHRAYNLGAEDAIEYNMFVGPPNRPIGVNIPNNEHLCGPPSTVEECRNDGWTTFNFPAPFADQGACVSYVRHRPRISVLVPEDPLQ